MKRLVFVSLTCLIFCIACEDDSIIIDPVDPPSTLVSFDELILGNESIFLAYRKTHDPNNGPGPINYTGDTLWLSVTGQTGNSYELEARSTLSNSRILYSMSISNDNLELERMTTVSPGFTFIDFDSIPPLTLTEITHPVLPINFEALSANCFESTCMARVVNHLQLGITYPRLNLLANFADMAVDGPGKYILYDKGIGIVRSATISAWTREETGWDLLNTN